jgi:hypothetical protein
MAEGSVKLPVRVTGAKEELKTLMVPAAELAA